ncbi:MAG: cyclic nucleotide-binding domain-containing protein [Betaproteobacteria bacterium]|nr:MAG: cyclic nucleotide-binding domain-containing protein [Betaproteobacteria bacterium]
MQQTRIQALQGMPIFGGIREDMLELLVSAAKMTAVPGGQHFFRENDKADAMFVLEAGEVSILKSRNKRQYEIGRLGPGDCFGEMALIDLLPRSASVLAVRDCTAITLSMESVHRLYEKDAEQFALILMNIGRELSRRLRAADKRLFSFKMGDPYRDAGDFPPLVW